MPIARPGAEGRLCDCAHLRAWPSGPTVAITKPIARLGGIMSSVASSHRGFPRARASVSVLLVALVLAPLGATRSQDTSTAGRRRTQDGPAAKAETTLMQRLA